MKYTSKYSASRFTSTADEYVLVRDQYGGYTIRMSIIWCTHTVAHREKEIFDSETLLLFQCQSWSNVNVTLQILYVITYCTDIRSIQEYILLTASVGCVFSTSNNLCRLNSSGIPTVRYSYSTYSYRAFDYLLLREQLIHCVHWYGHLLGTSAISKHDHWSTPRFVLVPWLTLVQLWHLPLCCRVAENETEQKLWFVLALLRAVKLELRLCLTPCGPIW